MADNNPKIEVEAEFKNVKYGRQLKEAEKQTQKTTDRIDKIVSGEDGFFTKGEALVAKVFAGIGMMEQVGTALNRVADGVTKMVTEWDKFQRKPEEFISEISKGIPLFGQFISLGEKITNIISGWAKQQAEFNKQMQNSRRLGRRLGERRALIQELKGVGFEAELERLRDRGDKRGEIELNTERAIDELITREKTLIDEISKTSSLSASHQQQLIENLRDNIDSLIKFEERRASKAMGQLDGTSESGAGGFGAVRPGVSSFSTALGMFRTGSGSVLDKQLTELKDIAKSVKVMTKGMKIDGASLFR